LEIDYLKNVDLIIIDEIGPFEMKGRGWAEAFSKILKELDQPLLISVREKLVDTVIEHWNLRDVKKYDVTLATAKDICSEISGFV
jgi:nucleoside-triphosphatase THEP1